MNIETYDKTLIEWLKAMRKFNLTESEIKKQRGMGMDVLTAMQRVGISFETSLTFIDIAAENEWDDAEIRHHVSNFLSN